MSCVDFSNLPFFCCVMCLMQALSIPVQHFWPCGRFWEKRLLHAWTLRGEQWLLFGCPQESGKHQMSRELTPMNRPRQSICFPPVLPLIYFGLCPFYLRGSGVNSHLWYFFWRCSGQRKTFLLDVETSGLPQKQTSRQCSQICLHACFDTYKQCLLQLLKSAEKIHCPSLPKSWKPWVQSAICQKQSTESFVFFSFF